MFKVIVAGTRTFTDWNLLSSTLDLLLQNKKNDHKIVIVSGKEPNGADALGERYAKEKGYLIEEYYPDWKKHGRAAGPIRNSEMAKNAHACVVFWDGKSRGTKSMIEEAEKQNLMLRVIKYKSI